MSALSDSPTKPITGTPGRSQQISTRIVFFIAGIGMATWAPLVPYAKARAQIDDGTLGLLLLCLGAGSIVAMPLAGALTAKIGCRLVIVASTILACLTLPILATASSLPGLMLSLLFFGAGVGALDVSMNVQAVIVEKASGRTMMSGFHGLFSLGGIVGAAGVSQLLVSGLTPVTAVAGVLVVIALALVISFPALLPYGSNSDGPLFALPRGIVLLIGIVCFVIFMMEGSVLDWSALFLTSHHGMATERAGLGYAAFACTMTIGRLTGDWIVRRLGNFKVVLLGSLCAAAGVAVTLIPFWPVALLGYALVGAGCSNIVPVMFSAAGRQTIMPENVAIPAITTLGYAGILVGPAAIGLITHVSSLSVAFAIMIALLIGVAVSGRYMKL
jgi:predicted MFS family arabinose efflux permease